MRSAPQLHFFAATEDVPNSPLPLLLWGGRAPISQDGGRDICRVYERSGWRGSWVDSVLPYWHFHTRGHEVLTCVSGRARIGFGGDTGFIASVKAGDVLAIPAGVGHKRLEASHDFRVAGAYPEGQEGNIVRPGDMDQEEIERHISLVPLPQTDPISGRDDGVVEMWKGDRSRCSSH